MRKNHLQTVLKALLAIYWLPAFAWADPNLAPGQEITTVSHGPTIAFTVPAIEHDALNHPVYIIPYGSSKKFDLAVTMHMWIRQTLIPWKDLTRPGEPRIPLIGILKNRHIAFIRKDLEEGDNAAIVSLADEKDDPITAKTKLLDDAIVAQLNKHLQENNVDGAYSALARHFDDASTATQGPGLGDKEASVAGRTPSTPASRLKKPRADTIEWNLASFVPLNGKADKIIFAKTGQGNGLDFFLRGVVRRNSKVETITVEYLKLPDEATGKFYIGIRKPKTGLRKSLDDFMDATAWTRLQRDVTTWELNGLSQALKRYMKQKKIGLSYHIATELSGKVDVKSFHELILQELFRRESR